MKIISGQYMRIRKRHEYRAIRLKGMILIPNSVRNATGTVKVLIASETMLETL